MTGTFCGLPGRMASVGAAVGAAVACAWLLSPLAVCTGAAMAFIVAGALRGLTPRERRWVAGLLGTALALRLLALLAFAAAVNYEDYQLPILIGDERTFKKVALSLRNINIGVPISPADFQAAYVWHNDSEGFFDILAYVQILFGPSPYGLHFLNIVYFFAGTVLLYRTARASYGRFPSLGGLAVLLFLPTLFVWSISGLREPLHTLTLAVLVVGALHTVRARTWARRLTAAALAAGSIVIMGSLRVGVLMGGIASVFAAYAGVIVTAKRWVWVLALILSCAVAVAAWQSSSVQARALDAVRVAASRHAGHVKSAGYGYKLLDERFYESRVDVSTATMTEGEVARFVLRAASSFVVVPAPWQATSRLALAFMPQQILYYVLFVLAFVGCWAGFRKDALLTFLLLANIAFYATGVALLNGNIGTLVRHRDLVVSMVVWLSALGAGTVLNWAAAHARRKYPEGLHRLTTLPAEA